MASNQTENYGLNQWEATDQVVRTDFNSDNLKIDAALHSMAETHDADVATLREERLWGKILDQTLTAAATSVTLEIPDAAKYEMLELHYTTSGADKLYLKLNDGASFYYSGDRETSTSWTLLSNSNSGTFTVSMAGGHVRLYQGGSCAKLLGECDGVMYLKDYYCQITGSGKILSNSIELSGLSKLVLTSSGSMAKGTRFVLYGLKK